MDYTTLITRYADGTYRVRIKRKMHFLPYTLKDIFFTKDRAQGFAKRLANKNKGNYYLQDLKLTKKR